MVKCAKELLNEYYLDLWGVDPAEKFQIEYVDAKQFLTPERLDLVFKLFYIDCKVKKKDMTYAVELYTAHIRAFSKGSFVEPGKEEKNTIEKYLDTFDDLIETLPKTGFSAEKSVVPVSADGNILDGSHRTAVAIYFDLKIPIIHINKECDVYDHRFFNREGLPSEYLEFAAYKYVIYSKKAFIACIWPAAKNAGKRLEAEELIRNSSKIIYKKEFLLTKSGLHSFMIHTYGLGRPNDAWAGDDNDCFNGLNKKAEWCFSANSSVIVYALTGLTLDKVVELKESIRNLFGIENHSVHITDTEYEAEVLAQVAYNDNSIDLLNYGCPFKYESFVRQTSRFREYVLSNGRSFDDYVMGKASLLSLYGIKNVRETDCCVEFPEALKIEGIKSIESSSELDAAFLNPKNYLFFRNQKYISIGSLSSCKAIRKLFKPLSFVEKAFYYYRKIQVYLNYSENKAFIIKKLQSSKCGNAFLSLFAGTKRILLKIRKS